MTDAVAIVGGRVVTGLGQEFDGGTVLLSGGRIDAVGSDLAVSDGARVLDATGCWVLPGLIDPHSHIGAHEEANGPAGFDGSEVSSPVTAGVRAIDAINIEDSAFRDALAGGITAVVVKPGSGNPIGGQSVAIKTAGGRSVDEQVIRAALGMKSALGENPKQTYGERKQLPSTRLGIALVIRQALRDAQDYAARRDKAHADGTPFAVDLGKHALAQALDGTLTWEQHAHRHDDIATALRIADEFGLRLVLNHGTEAHKLAGVLAERDVPVIYGPILSSRSKVEVREADPANLAALAAAGVRVALTDRPPSCPSVCSRCRRPWPCGRGCRGDRARGDDLDGRGHRRHRRPRRRAGARPRRGCGSVDRRPARRRLDRAGGAHRRAHGVHGTVRRAGGERMTLRDDAARLQPELVELRRRLHRIPEPGFDLPLTQRAVLDAIDGLGLEITTGSDLSSVTGVLRGATDGPSVLLRGDMDALAIVEETGLDYASTNGAMHACGHDLHVAGLVGAARLLAARRDRIAGSVVFMFQPGEEAGGGAPLMIRDGVLDAAGTRVEAAYGIHVGPGSVARSSSRPAPSWPGRTCCGCACTGVEVTGRGRSRPWTRYRWWPS